MSRVGKTPITIPNQVTVEPGQGTVTVRGPKGVLNVPVPRNLTVTVKDQIVNVTLQGKTRKDNALHGLVRANIQNAVTGVTDGFTKTLELVGVGYRANLQGTGLVLHLGLSHSIDMPAPAGIAFEVKEGKILVSGIDKYMVGQTAADIRAFKKPEPYKGKGIRYSGEYIRKKAGKAKSAGGTAGK